MTPDLEWIELESMMDSRVRDICKKTNRLHYHTTDSVKSEAGFPDWVVVLDDAVIFAEMKRGLKEKMSKEQTKWITSMLPLSKKRHVYLIKGESMLSAFELMIGMGNTNNIVSHGLYKDSLKHICKDYNKWLKKDGEIYSPDFEKALTYSQRILLKK